LTIEHPFGIVIGKEVPVTKHDAARKQKIVDFIAATVRARGYPPTVREIAVAVDLASTSAVHHHLEALEREGIIERGGSHSRAITLTSQTALRAGLVGYAGSTVVPFDGRTLPVIGEIAAGGPIEAYQDSSETLAVPEAVAANGDAYVLRVRGDSMIDAHITDGDYVVIRPQQTAHDGDIVVAQVEENAVTLKRFFKEKDRVRLQPANDQYPPQFYDTVRIQGKLIGVIRRVD
jgi:repressor LexA